MALRQWFKTLIDIVRPGQSQGQSRNLRKNGAVTHVLILDGTMSTLVDGCESNAGLAYKLLDAQGGPSLSVFYEAGLQWQDWRGTRDIITGCGINRQIRRAYGYLASRYRPGDRIFLLGYSRGAFAVRSLAGAIDAVGLLKPDHATQRNVRLAYRHYKSGGSNAIRDEFRAAYCHEKTEIEMVGVWDTVKALGLRLPVVWRWVQDANSFHNHQLGPSIRHGFHALALNETRAAFAPVLWSSDDAHDGHMEQVWFRGTHGDIGGQLGGFEAARPLANIPFVWMLERAETCGLSLPDGWQTRFPRDAQAPSVGNWRGWGKWFIKRRRRIVGRDPSERLHETAADTPAQAPHAQQTA